MSKARYFKTLVPVFIRLDDKNSDEYVTLNGTLQASEDLCGNTYFDTSDVVIEQIHKRQAPKELV